ncbi:aldehyde dehydrogenase family protein [Paenibacillus sp. Y412MC10]|uniref:aldehyde dehydrogenase family protein n=1 Tax=Geobacillus sp. (strain Y412MC10) TaxID=481743 RepID=UPI0011AB38D9|nr:aldehyde dehydrogenase family protein [Paenibacillus sp. Y412MC10]
MKVIDQHYINGRFVPSQGRETMDLISPVTEEVIGKVVLGDERDIRDAITAAKAAFPAFSRTSIAERGEMLQRLHDAVMARVDELTEAAVQEYGSPLAASRGRTVFAAKAFLLTKEAMASFDFERVTGTTKVVMEPLGVVGAITPWNANYTHICGKIAPALATGNTIVVKPSEISALQTQILTECLAAAEIPAGVINIVNGTGTIVGAEISSNPDISIISFTGSTGVGKTIARDSAATLKRLALELGGKSPNIILDDANFKEAIPRAIQIAFSNTGQACHAGTRLLIPASRLEEAKKLLIEAVSATKLGYPDDPNAALGPLVSRKQFDTVQHYIQAGIDEGAELITGGLGRFEGFEHGYFARPTVFIGAKNDMKIAREEIFGPVLSVIAYETEEEAVSIANDTIYGLAAYVSSGDHERASRVASQIVAGRVLVNKGVHDDPYAPFGGFKQSGIGRDSGHYGLEEFVEPKALLGFTQA